MSSPLTGDISNSNRDNTDLPIYNSTYTVYGQNFRRSHAEAVHNHGHQLRGNIKSCQPFTIWEHGALLEKICWSRRKR